MVQINMERAFFNVLDIDKDTAAFLSKAGKLASFHRNRDHGHVGGGRASGIWFCNPPRFASRLPKAGANGGGRGQTRGRG
jgi:hypothetical protein